LRILLVSEQHSSEGGAEAIVSGLLAGLDDRGHDVGLLTARLAPDAAALPARAALLKTAWAPEGASADPASAAEAVALAESFAPDVVHLHNIFDSGVVDALRTRWPSVWQCHDYRANCPNGDRVFPRSRRVCELPMGRACVANALLQGCVAGPRVRSLRAIRLRERLFAELTRADRIASPSACVTRLLLGNGVETDRIAQIPLFTPFADEPLAPAYPSQPTVLFAGRLVPQKGIRDVLWAAQAVARRRPDSRTLIAGAGPERAAVDEARRRCPAIEALGKLTEFDLRAAYARASVVAVTPRWLDPFPLVGLEAFAFARPVVGYRLGGLAELVETGSSGELVEPGDRHALARALASMLEDPARADAMGRRGRELVRARHRPKHGLSAMENVFAQALAKRAQRLSKPDIVVELFEASADAARWRAALEVRLAVFVREQDVPMELELDAHDTDDPTCIHAAATRRGGRTVATGRIYGEDANVGRIGRMAVLPALRGFGLGMAILDALLLQARRRGYRTATLDAQIPALGFYARRGFRPEGRTFLDAGIEHQRMSVDLS